MEGSRVTMRDLGGERALVGEVVMTPMIKQRRDSQDVFSLK